MFCFPSQDMAIFLFCPMDMFFIKCLYLGKEATKQKNKSTLFSSTFKVWESKVTLFLNFMLLSRNMAIFWFCPMDMLFHKMVISRKRGSKTKNMDTLFTSTFKFWESKVTLFLNFMLLSRSMAIFWFCPMDMLFHKMAISRKRGSKTKKQGHFIYFNF